MSVPAGARATMRALCAALALALALVGPGCGKKEEFAALAPTATPPGQPPGTLVRPAETNVDATVQGVRDAISTTGGTVVTVVDHTVEPAGKQIPPNTEVIGGPPAAALPLLRVNQRAGLNLPQRYLVRQRTDGVVTVVSNSADYVAAVSGVRAPDARAALHDTTGAVLEKAAAPAVGKGHPAPLVGVTPTDRIVERSAEGDVAATVERLRAAADRPPSRTVAVLDMAAGSEQGGPPIRPTTLVLVSHPEAEDPLLAAAPTIGIDLPLPFLVWLDERGDSRLAYPDVGRLAERHGLPPDDPSVDRLAAEMERLAVAGATGSGRGR